MKGQFFIIAGVLIVSLISLIFQYFYDFTKINPSLYGNFYERNYIYEIKEMYINVINLSTCESLEEELKVLENELFLDMISRGILFNGTHSGNCPGTITIRFSLISEKFNSNTSFSFTK
ncbi:MAG: hypothetical protein QW469_01890 [Candidatus Aenigmatarchaeota archaeon]